MTEPQKIPPELNELSNRIGDFIQYWGFKKIHGRIWLHLFVSPEPLDAGELIKRLEVSKALVSMSLSDLIKFDVIREMGKSDRGTQLYGANPKVVEVVLNVLKQREKEMLRQIASAHLVVKELDPSQSQRLISRERLDCLEDMIEQAQDTLDGLLALYQVDFSKWQSFEA